ncbi:MULTISPECIES: MarR family winged helix-turn-helix transcriptional regulator [unclassified Rhizobium]|uniref:MarR family winged helix-turn-helix transcriptional regulator n=1 Tax=unclassified Rhizobium TaxID=2613769 RepID=UPI001A9975C4|nr:MULTISPECIES: MarR family winged helix-turn-helix transcriptional regulator [unclassified Rhizobium]MBX5157121.1 winged helix-turn-helix transcriptional regulator [Rhizobium sp. NZLR8]MBX5165120.1 winged helix-turn-helix transcriptional regulator [Rhizobium sp. NZLR4b]MBX5172697.1 winged helix-turn-helix transcriptional regulator [Rhizobium sp. NZLR1b]MBX5185208.1 winged helix-turn-helix transcriptional regulator [Rhizobium sp. NZLR5]MBX5195456.1 winged helix-turn-helix transcriptional regu
MSNSIEIPFSTTLLVRDTCLCLHVQRAARALARLFDDALRPAGLTNGQFSLLMSLNRPEPPPMGPVAALLAMDQTTLTAALKPLQRKGWVTVVENPRDRRGRLLVLTGEGKAALARALPIWESTHAGIDGTLPDGNCTRLRGDLQALSSMTAEIPKSAPSPRRSRHGEEAAAE